MQEKTFWSSIFKKKRFYTVKIELMKYLSVLLKRLLLMESLCTQFIIHKRLQVLYTYSFLMHNSWSVKIRFNVYGDSQENPL